MEDDYGSNVHEGLDKSVRFKVSAFERFFYKGFLRNSSRTKFFVRLREVPALEDVRLREVSLYSEYIVELKTKMKDLGNIHCSCILCQ